MPSGGDVILYGHYARGGCTSFLDERGSHAGPSAEELYGFLALPPRVAFDPGQGDARPGSACPLRPLPARRLRAGPAATWRRRQARCLRASR